MKFILILVLSSAPVIFANSKGTCGALQSCSSEITTDNTESSVKLPQCAQWLEEKQDTNQTSVNEDANVDR